MEMLETLMHDSKNWVAVAFFLFVAGFARYALPHILRGLDGRSAQINRELEEAVKLRHSAQALLAEYQQRQKEMLSDAEQMIAHAKQEATTMRVQAEADLKALVERRTKMAHEKIARAEQAAVADVRQHMVGVSIAATHDILSEALADDAHQDALVKQAMKDIERIVH